MLCVPRLLALLHLTLFIAFDLIEFDLIDGARFLREDGRIERVLYNSYYTRYIRYVKKHYIVL